MNEIERADHALWSKTRDIVSRAVPPWSLFFDRRVDMNATAPGYAILVLQ